MTLLLAPYVAFGDLAFNLTAEELVARLGPPRRRVRNAAELVAYDYGHLVCRFQDNGRLEEITRRAAVLQVGTVAVPFGALAGFARGHDDQAFERAGFLVSPALGLAWVPEEPDWVTALARHCLPTWRAMRG